MNTFCVGLRRSGTTIFWKTFRQDARLTCYDEPFNPFLRELPQEHSKMVRAEFITLFRKDTRLFWERFSPISRPEELQRTLSDRQSAYLSWLLSMGANVFMDLTRCCFKLAALHAVDPGAVCVHLFRSPESFTSSHMIPTRSHSNLKERIRTALSHRHFFTRTDNFDYYGFEEITGQCADSAFGHILRDAGFDPEEFYRFPAFARLLVFWKVVHERVETDGRKMFGDRFLSIPFESFAADPAAVTERVYSALGVAPAPLDFSAIHPESGPFKPDNPNWRLWMKKLGLS